MFAVMESMAEDAFRMLTHLDASGRCHFVARQDGRSNWAMNRAIVARFPVGLRSTSLRGSTKSMKTAELSGNKPGNRCRIPRRGHSNQTQRLSTWSGYD